jgi:hypothetical protein
MVDAITVITNLLGAGAFAAGAYLAVEYVLPQVKIIAAEILRYPKTAGALVYLLTIVVYLAAAQGILSRLIATGIPNVNYINIVNPVLDLLNGLAPTIQLVLIGLGAVLIAERIRLK